MFSGAAAMGYNVSENFLKINTLVQNEAIQFKNCRKSNVVVMVQMA